ncbi:heat shock protein GrpE [Clostridium sp. C105KSO13]|nr:nucleotide exchange factor GrpE [Clostridium sp. C105KSO13]CUX47756.1 heat shock protein GrpE [Clostridium sp. C105KSO13]
MSNEDMVKEAVEEAKAKAAVETEEETAKDEAAKNAADRPAPPVEDVSDDTPDTQQEENSGATAEEQPEPKDEKEQSGRKKFGRKSKKDEKDEKIEELTDRLTRQIAEFDNFRKRTDKEKSQMYEIGARDIIEKILPVVDNFERGLEAVSEGEESNPFAEGMEKIYKQLMAAFEEIGVKPIEALGAEFNPDFHNAVMHVEDENLGENIVAEEFQKGYTYRDSVVRHSMVKVAN